MKLNKNNLNKDFIKFSNSWVDTIEYNYEIYDYFENEDTFISFLNEYYVVYPKKIPKVEIK